MNALVKTCPHCMEVIDFRIPERKRKTIRQLRKNGVKMDVIAHEMNINVGTVSRICKETNGDEVKIVKSEVAGKLELSAILRIILENLFK